jgi:hypothetical protein
VRGRIVGDEGERERERERERVWQAIIVRTLATEQTWMQRKNRKLLFPRQAEGQ